VVAVENTVVNLTKAQMEASQTQNFSLLVLIQSVSPLLKQSITVIVIFHFFASGWKATIAVLKSLLSDFWS